MIRSGGGSGYVSNANALRSKEQIDTNSYGNECTSPLRGPFHLGHVFKTDILSISIESETYLTATDISFWYSLLYAILGGVSQALGIRRGDLDGCLHPSDRGMTLVLFDKVPRGGKRCEV